MAWNWNPIPTPGPAQTFIDVGAPLFNPNPRADLVPMYAFWVGSDHTLWRMQTDRPSSWEKVTTPPGASPLTRVAVAPDNTAWSVTEDDQQPFYLLNGDISNNWKTPSNFFVDHDIRSLDVCVARDSSIWIASTNSNQWISSNQGISHIDGRTFSFGLSLMALAGFTEPVSDDNSGGAWGIIRASGPPGLSHGGTIAFCDKSWRHIPPNGGSFISNVVDISLSPKYLWMVKTDGTVWTTRDGVSGVPMGDTFRAKRISGSYVSEQDTGVPLGETAYAVGADGLPYVWSDG